ncbi:probable serine/threonine-protein kinase roco5 [Lineus longissimus]|uniref:probable serine/threonine-protein kinase roco5 n=1 Tax=Lineus longissimus TaxID=88925 RepID=UPI00315C98B4
MPRNYVDNASNRRLGRVGMVVGSMPVSRGSSGSSFGGYGSTKTYVDNSYNRSLGRVGMEHGTAVVSRSSASGVSSGYSGSPKTYVDNSYNRSLGRVGMEHGTAVVSRSSASGVSSGYSGSPKTYVDNSYNRSLGRVGMEHGTAVVSRSSASGVSSGYSGSPKTYVDNSYNRSLGRVGMEHGTAVASRSSSAAYGNGASPKTYVDNALNRSLGRVGLPHGTAVLSEFGPSGSGLSSTYVDNDYNRRLGRVGLEKGTAVVSKSASSSRDLQFRVYKDNDFNRRIGRVGLPLGSMVVSRSSKLSQSRLVTPRQTSKRWQASRDLLYRFLANPDDDMDFDYGPSDPETQKETTQQVIDVIHRMEEVRLWQEKSHTNRKPSTSRALMQSYQGERIIFKELDLKKKIGHGGFGDVYFAEWKGTVVAVKKLRVQRVSQKCLKEFHSEIRVFCMLDHPNIVKFLGACVVTPKVAIVMEYMEKSLFQKIHMEDDDISEEGKLSIMSQVVNGLDYLHLNGIAHCDVKSQNVLLNYEEATGQYVAKITDFGLSIMKSDADASTTKTGQVQGGTPRYSSPEVLRGEILNRKAMMKSDVYSLGLVLYEIICAEEPFSGYNQMQLVRFVGNGRVIPDFGDDINPSVTQVVEQCWKRNPLQRPSTSYLRDNMCSFPYLYEL